MSSIRLQIKDSIMHYLCDDWNNHKRGKAHKENQALFDRKDGYAMWNTIDLEMIMEKVVKGIYAVDLAEHDKQIRNEVIIGTLESVIKMIDDLGYEDLTSIVLRENLKARIEQLKGERNE